MNSYSYLLKYSIHHFRKQENYRARLKIFAKLFDEIHKNLDILENQHLIEHAEGFFLDYMGNLFNLKRNKMSDEAFRFKIKIEYQKKYLKPTMDNLIELLHFIGVNIRRFNAGHESEEKEPLRYIFQEELKPNEEAKITLQELESLVGAGVRLTKENITVFYERCHVTGSPSAITGRTIIKRLIREFEINSEELTKNRYHMTGSQDAITGRELIKRGVKD